MIATKLSSESGQSRWHQLYSTSINKKGICKNVNIPYLHTRERRGGGGESSFLLKRFGFFTSWDQGTTTKNEVIRQLKVRWLHKYNFFFLKQQQNHICTHKHAHTPILVCIVSHIPFLRIYGHSQRIQY